MADTLLKAGLSVKKKRNNIEGKTGKQTFSARRIFEGNTEI